MWSVAPGRPHVIVIKRAIGFCLRSASVIVALPHNLRVRSQRHVRAFRPQSVGSIFNVLIWSETNTIKKNPITKHCLCSLAWTCFEIEIRFPRRFSVVPSRTRRYIEHCKSNSDSYAALAMRPIDVRETITMTLARTVRKRSVVLREGNYD